MFKKIKNVFYFVSVLIFVISISSFYFSNKNIIKTNKSRSFYSVEKNKALKDLPILKSDTNDIIVYKKDVEIYKTRKKKYEFWKLLKKD